MKKHTPGPWVVKTSEYGVEGIYSVPLGDKHEARIVETDGGFYPPRIEDARLIAAAPELLEALKLALRMGESAGWWARGGSDREAFESMQAAIAKAEGKS